MEDTNDRGNRAERGGWIFNLVEGTDEEVSCTPFIEMETEMDVDVGSLRSCVGPGNDVLGSREEGEIVKAKGNVPVSEFPCEQDGGNT